MAIANLLIKIGADISELQTNSQKATREIEKVGTRIDSIGSSIKASIIGAFSISAVVGFGRELLAMGDSIVRTADRTGLLISEVQKLGYIAGQSGNSIEELTGGIGQMQNRLASGDKSALAAVKALGLSFDTLRNQSPYEQLQSIAESVAKIPNPAQRAQVAMDLFGRSGIALMPTLISNFKELGDQAPTMSDSTVRALDAAGDSLDRFTKQAKVWAAESYNFFGKVFDAGIASIYDFVSDAYKATAKLLELTAKVPGASRVFGDLSDNVKGLRDTAQWYSDAAKAMDYQIAHGGETARKTVPQFKALASTTNELTDAQKKAKAAAEAHVKAIAGLREELSGQGAVKAAQDMLEAFRKMPPVQNLTADAQKKINQTMSEALDVFTALGKEPPAAIRKVYQETFTLTDTLPLINRWKEGLAHSADGLLTLVKISDRLGKDSWPKTIDGFERLLPIVGRLVPQVKTLGKTIKDDLINTLEQIPKIVVGAFTGGGGIGGAIKSIGSTIGATLGKAIGASFKALGSFGGPIGEAVGSLVGPLIGKIGQLLGIGATEYEKRMRAAAQETKTLQDQLVSSHGSMAQLIIDADLVGINIKEAFNWKDPEAFKNVVSDLEAKTTLLAAAMDEYGFTWEDLGEKARGAKLGQLFDELYEKTQILKGAGIDYHEILLRQSDDYSKLVQAAIRTGTEIPASMRPVLEDLIEMGTLVDENGQSFKDLSQVTFAKTLTQGFDQVTQAIYDLTDALTHGVGGALDELGRRTVRIPIKFDVENPPHTAAPEYATGTRGAFHNFGAGQYVKLHGYERIVTEAESLGVDSGGTVTLSAPDALKLLQGEIISVTRKDASRGGLKPRASSGRSY